MSTDYTHAKPYSSSSKRGGCRACATRRGTGAMETQRRAIGGVEKGIDEAGTVMGRQTNKEMKLRTQLFGLVRRSLELDRREPWL